MVPLLEMVGSHNLQPQQNVHFQQTDALVDIVVAVKDSNNSPYNMYK
jgi:hypothetical protein